MKSQTRVSAGKSAARANPWVAFIKKKGLSPQTTPKKGTPAHAKLMLEYRGGNPFVTAVAQDLIMKKEKPRINRVAKFLGFGLRGVHKGMLKFQAVGGSIFWQHPSVTAGHWLTDKITGSGFFKMPNRGLTGNFHRGPRLSGRRMMEMAQRGEGLGQHWEVSTSS